MPLQENIDKIERIKALIARFTDGLDNADDSERQIRHILAPKSELECLRQFISNMDSISFKKQQESKTQSDYPNDTVKPIVQITLSSLAFQSVSAEAVDKFVPDFIEFIKARFKVDGVRISLTEKEAV